MIAFGARLTYASIREKPRFHYGHQSSSLWIGQCLGCGHIPLRQLAFGGDYRALPSYPTTLPSRKIPVGRPRRMAITITNDTAVAISLVMKLSIRFLVSATI